jgi:hypothetical protein
LVPTIHVWNTQTAQAHIETTKDRGEVCLAWIDKCLLECFEGEFMSQGGRWDMEGLKIVINKRIGFVESETSAMRGIVDGYDDAL